MKNVSLDKNLATTSYGFHMLLMNLFDGKIPSFNKDGSKVTQQNLADASSLWYGDGTMLSNDQIKHMKNKKAKFPYSNFKELLDPEIIEGENVGPYFLQNRTNYFFELFRNNFLFINAQHEANVLSTVIYNSSNSFVKNYNQRYVNKFNEEVEGHLKIKDQLTSLRGLNRTKANKLLLQSLANTIPKTEETFEIYTMYTLGKVQLKTLNLPPNRKHIWRYSTTLTDMPIYRDDNKYIGNWPYYHSGVTSDSLLLKEVQDLSLVVSACFREMENVTIKHISSMTSEELKIENPIFMFSIWKILKTESEVLEVFNQPSNIKKYVKDNQEFLEAFEINIGTPEEVEIQIINLYISFLEFRNSNNSFLSDQLKEKIVCADKVDAVLKNLKQNTLLKKPDIENYNLYVGKIETEINKVVKYQSILITNLKNTLIGNEIKKINDLDNKTIPRLVRKINKNIKVRYSLEEILEQYNKLNQNEIYFSVELHMIITSSMLKSITEIITEIPMYPVQD